MTEPTWEEGPWLVEVRNRYVVRGCSSDTAVRAVRALENGMDLQPGDIMPHHNETMPEVSEAIRSIIIHPEGNTPFPDDWLTNEGDRL